MTASTRSLRARSLRARRAYLRRDARRCNHVPDFVALAGEVTPHSTDAFAWWFADGGPKWWEAAR